MAKEKKDELVVQSNNTAVAIAMDEIESYVAENEIKDIKSDEVITPRIAVLQSGSPQVKKSDPDYVAGAGEGDIFNTSSKKVYEGGAGIYFVPCKIERTFNEWIPKNLGGGLVKRWGEDESFKTSYIEEKGKWQQVKTDEKGKQVVATEIVKTADYYALVVDIDTGMFYPAVIGFSGTKYKIHRKLINDVSLPDYKRGDGNFITPPPFYRVYHAVTVPESNENGSWFNYKINRHSTINDLKNSKAIWEAAKEFRKLIEEGKVIAAAEQQDEFKAHSHDNNEATPL